MELAIAKLPNWLEPQIRNLNCQSFEELSEAIVRHQGNSRIKREKDYPKREEKREFKKEDKQEPWKKRSDTTMEERGASKIHTLDRNRILLVRKERACETRLPGKVRGRQV